MDAETETEHVRSHLDQPPGTVSLENCECWTWSHGLFSFPSSDFTNMRRLAVQLSSDKVILHPVPTRDPNDPLNWSTWRKTVNLSLAMLYVLMTFVQPDIGFTAWNAYETELGLTVPVLNGGTAFGYAGLGLGSFVFIPLMHKYGRRPLYIFSTALQLAATVWLARTHNQTDMWLSNLLAGLGGATCETIVQVTISDLFFIHQHAAMNAFYILFTQIGAYLGPVAAGFVVENMHWRWIFYFCVIFFGVLLVLVVFFYEESKFVIAREEQEQEDHDLAVKVKQEHMDDPEHKMDLAAADHHEFLDRTQSRSYINYNIPIKSYRERMALITPSEGSIFRGMLEPFVTLFTFPAVAYTALSFGTVLAMFAILTTVQATYMFSPPYNFTAIGVGLMNIAPFVGSIPGVVIGGWLNDKSIIWLSRRNNGIYEPEMRLWLALPFAIIGPAGVLMLGVGLAYVSSYALYPTFLIRD